MGRKRKSVVEGTEAAAPKRRASRAKVPAQRHPAPMSTAEIAKLKTVGKPYTETGYIQTLSPLKGPNGHKQTEITINQHTYKFMANKAGHFVTHVPYADDFAAILSIGAGYQRYGKKGAAPGGAPSGSVQMPTIDEEGGDEDAEAVLEAQVPPSRAVAKRGAAVLTIDPAAG